MNASTTTASRRPTAGIDWASEDHAVAVVDPDGVAIQRCTIQHTGVGLRGLVKTLQRAGVEAVGIERPDGPVVDALLEHGFTVFVIAPSQVKNLRSRHGSAGKKDDRFDAYVLADVVRTDRHRLTALTQDSPQTITLRMTVRARKDLIAARVAMANQLRAHLQSTLPGAIGLFRDIDSRSPWRSSAGSPPKRRLTASVPPACRRGCARPATTTPPTPRRCTPTSPLRLAARSARKPPPALQSPSRWSPR